LLFVDDQLEGVYTGELCDTGNKQKISTVIQFVCSTEDVSTGWIYHLCVVYTDNFNTVVFTANFNTVVFTDNFIQLFLLITSYSRFY